MILQGDKPTLKQYLEDYTQRKLHNDRGFNRSRSRHSSVSNKSDNQFRQYYARQVAYKQELARLRRSIQPYVTNLQEKAQINRRLDHIYFLYLRDTQICRYRNTQKIQSEASTPKKSHSSEKMNRDEYYYRLKALRSRTQDNLKKKNDQIEVNDQKFDITKYKGMKESSPRTVEKK